MIIKMKHKSDISEEINIVVMVRIIKKVKPKQNDAQKIGEAI